MHIFEYPYIIVTIFVICFVVLSLFGIKFAISGVRTVKGKDENEFVNINKLESNFSKSGKLRENRSILYICADIDNYQSMYSKSETANVIEQIRKILVEMFSEGENSAVSKYSENKFVVFSKLNIEEIRKNIELCQTRLNKCLLKHSALNVIEVRFGVYVVSGTQMTFDEAVSRAKQAYMVAENEGLDYSEWNVSSGKALEKKIKIENNIENEIDNNRFFLEYQPVLDAKTKKIIGAEVLSRLNSESEGILTPGSFLSAVDSVGLNNKFDYYIFEKNCKWISNDKKQRERFKYTINFSRSTLCEPEFAEKIVSIAQKYDLKFSCLAVEILEDKNVTGEDRKHMVNNLAALKEKGFSVLLDDFGSGYTAFSDLQNLDISIVKIDKSITHNAVTDTGFIILENIIRTSQGIGFKTLCEGIETKEQEEAAVRAGCDMLQGFYYYKPMNVTKLEKIFEENHGGI